MPETIPVAFISMPGGLEWLVIGLVALLLFGKRLPGVASSLGQALREFRTGLAGQIDGEKSETAGKAGKPPEKPEA
jgi:sec-independent protein translocase protein TatA